ncbi:MAG: hypothetical protein M3Y57_19020 [Acidobacteriota bacterium]|nr:hypothetical protein [Acidobacteriota bacterium]
MMGLPAIAGGPISIFVRPELSVIRGKLLSGVSGRGTQVYAASFIRDREIVLETTLLADEAVFKLIFAHEIFHFVWAGVGNGLRHSFEALLRYERRRHARGELGESSAVKKPHCEASFRRWKDYVCESFCDTGAWLYSGVNDQDVFTLAERWRKKRADWFRAAFERYTEA